MVRHTQRAQELTTNGTFAVIPAKAGIYFLSSKNIYTPLIFREYNIYMNESLKIFYIIINTILTLTLLVWPLGLFLVPFMFDAPGSENNIIGIILAICIILYPIPVLKGTVGYWKNKKDNFETNYKKYTLIGLSGPFSIFILALLLDIIYNGNSISP